MSSNWQLFMSGRHRRRGRIWQSFFTGWGLFFTIALVSSPFIFRNMSWAILDTIDMDSVRQNNLSMTNPRIFGTDKNGEPFAIQATAARQRFDNQNAIHFDNPSADVIRIKGGEKITDKITATRGRLETDTQKIILVGNVRVKSSDGTSGTANEMEIDLK